MEVKKLRELLNISQQELSDKTGIPKERIAKWEQGRGSPKAEDSKTLEKFFGDKVPRENGTVEESKLPYHVARREKKMADKAPVPIYGGFTTLGNIEVIDDDNMKNKVVAELPAEVFPGCDYAEKAKGDSMYPLIMNQALLVGKTCSLKGIVYGEKYIIKTKDGLDSTKYVHPGKDKNSILLKAYNKSVPDQEVAIKDIVFACRVQWIINPT